MNNAIDQTEKLVTSASMPQTARRCWLWMLYPMAREIREWSKLDGKWVIKGP